MLGGWRRLNMKNQYAGDINDFRKYAILRALATCGFRVTVCWMLTPDDGGPDGRKVVVAIAQVDGLHHRYQRLAA